MKERRELLASIANTIKDYRTGDLPEPTPDHADRWIRQFKTEFQLPMLREMDHVLRQTYFSRSRVRDFFASVTGSRRLAGEDPREFWRAAHLLDVQQGGNSQTEIRKLFSEELERNYGLAANAGVPNDAVFVYLDDVLFTGSRIGNDLSAWIVDVAPQAGDGAYPYYCQPSLWGVEVQYTVANGGGQRGQAITVSFLDGPAY